MAIARKERPLASKVKTHIPPLFQLPTPWPVRSRWHLVATLLGVLVLPMGTLLYLIQTQVGTRLEEQAVYQNAMAAHLVSRSVKEHFEGLMNDVESFSQRSLLTELIEKKDVEGVRAQLKEWVTNNKDFDRAFFVDAAGTLWADYPGDNSVLGVNFSFRDWYQGVSRTQRTYLSEIYQRTAYPQPYITAIAVPIWNARREVTAYLVGQHRVEALMTWLLLIQPSTSGSVRLMDHHGRLITKPGSSSQPLTDLSRNPILKKMCAGQADSVKGKDPVTGMMSLMSCTRIPSIGWTVLVAQPASVISNTTRQLQGMILGLFGLFLFLMLGLGFACLNVIRRYQQMLLKLHEAREQYFASLEQVITERKQAEDGLQAANHELKMKMDELARINRIMMDRETRVLELKEKLRFLQGPR